MRTIRSRWFRCPPLRTRPLPHSRPLLTLTQFSQSTTSSATPTAVSVRPMLDPWFTKKSVQLVQVLQIQVKLYTMPLHSPIVEFRFQVNKCFEFLLPHVTLIFCVWISQVVATPYLLQFSCLLEVSVKFILIAPDCSSAQFCQYKSSRACQLFHPF